ncbi:MAG: type I-B CRISPR-associated protein Cas7/Cst2/DevR [Spirochaetes bacterium]|nr:type I-B CRISPR-associated protein Cas7/Cst2/DevR [Spirochaetota bacterium]
MNEQEQKNLVNQEAGIRRYIVLDVVFYANSLNYDQGAGNYQELKKITKWDGKQHILVSRYALRYSILHWANKLFPNDWKLAGTDELICESGGVARLKSPDEVKKDKKYSDFMEDVFLDYPEFDLFGFMIAPTRPKKPKESTNEESQEELKKDKESGTSITRTSPVKISHALSLTPYNYDSQFTANLDVMKRAGGAGSNPVTIEEKRDFYVYNITIDVDRIGKYPETEHGKKEIGDIDVSDKRNGRIKELIETVFTLKREIKGRMEDLSPWLVICGLYNNGNYDTYLDRIELAKSHSYKVITKEKETKSNDGETIKEVENEIIEKDAPKFLIDIDSDFYPNEAAKEDVFGKVDSFLKGELKSPEILIYTRPFIQYERMKK